MSRDGVTLFYRQGTADKEYHAAIEESNGGFVVNFAFGRRGSTLQTGVKTAMPVPYEDAKRIFDKLVREKQTKGYTPGTNGAAYQHTSNEQRSTGLLPQLLNPVDESEVARLIEDTAFWMQQKYDGRRILLRKDDNGDVAGINRKGLIVSLPVPIIECAHAMPGTFIIDGEALGDKLLLAFDCLSRNGQPICQQPYSKRLEVLMQFVCAGAVIKVAPTAKSTDKKRALYGLLQTDGKEGVVFKRHDAAYMPGRPASGGPQLKFKFYSTGSFIVAKVNNGKRSVALDVFNDAGHTVYVGNVTILPNHAVPSIGAVVECRYLYCFPNGGSLFQPVYLGQRDDLEPAACSTEQLKFKSEDDDAYWCRR